MKEGILYRQSNGIVAITTPLGGYTAQMVLDDSSEGGRSPALMSYVKNKHWTIIDLDNHLPTDSASHVFRDAWTCLLYTSPSPRDATLSRMPSSA